MTPMKIPATGIQNNSRDIPSTIANDKHKPNNLIFSFSLAIALAFIVLIIANINAITLIVNKIIVSPMIYYK
ncbi:hypothetical protein ONA00_03230 [Mycoplasmopsis cynos]|uniref:hypothetical protein n=1 Tax=Mycoplasmopsis cynos TaxID=171284 RepID=UPI0024CDA7F2|nr:hypothetical protein [Mycoplasmopsis cynos]WAM11444.1 hypothetical protein ONA00_03230 [Mycoplasmopsis cynos]